MRILKQVEYQISEDPDTKLVQVEKPGLFGSKKEWTKVTNYSRQVHLTLYVTKSKGFTWNFGTRIWLQMQNEMKRNAVYVGGGETQNGQSYYFYGYEERFFVSEIQLELADIPTLITREKETKKEKLQKEIDR